MSDGRRTGQQKGLDRTEGSREGALQWRSNPNLNRVLVQAVRHRRRWHKLLAGERDSTPSPAVVADARSACEHSPPAVAASISRELRFASSSRNQQPGVDDQGVPLPARLSTHPGASCCPLYHIHTYGRNLPTYYYLLKYR